MKCRQKLPWERSQKSHLHEKERQLERQTNRPRGYCARRIEREKILKEDKNVSRQTDGRTDGHTGRWANGWADRKIDGWRGIETDKQTDIYIQVLGQRGRQIHKQTEL